MIHLSCDRKRCLDLDALRYKVLMTFANKKSEDAKCQDICTSAQTYKIKDSHI